MARSDPRPTRDLRPVPPASGGADSDVPRPTPLVEGVPLGELVPRSLIRRPELVLLDTPQSVPAEKFRRLKTRLLHEHSDAHVLLVTSPAPNEGKSFVSVNLALALAEEGTETLLIDADLRRPTIQGWLNPPPSFGLSDVLLGKVPFEHALLHLKSPVLWIVPAGGRVPEPGSLFAGEAFQDLIRMARAKFRRIIIDTPPIVPFSDADAIGGAADGLLMVARAQRTVRSAYLQALSLVTSTRVLGVVLNDVVSGLADHDHYHDSYYSEYYTRSRRKS